MRFVVLVMPGVAQVILRWDSPDGTHQAAWFRNVHEDLVVATEQIEEAELERPR